MSRFENDMVKKKIIIRGLESQKSIYDAVRKFFKNELKIGKSVEIEQARKMFENQNKMTVMVELRSISMVAEVFKHTKNLAGKSIYVERELGADRRQNKSIMLELKRDILKMDKTKRVTVKDDLIIVDGKRLFWSKEKKLMCDEKLGEEVLKQIYGEKIISITLDYNKIFNKLNSKNC